MNQQKKGYYGGGSTSASSSMYALTNVGSATLGKSRVDGADSGPAGRPLKDLEKAVYGYIRAVRALGRTSINTADIAQALGISVAEVESTLIALNKKGVKFAA